MQRATCLAIIGGLIGFFVGGFLFSPAEGIDHGMSRLGIVACVATGAALGAIIGAAGDITTAMAGGSKPLPRWFLIGLAALAVLIIILVVLWLFMRLSAKPAPARPALVSPGRMASGLAAHGHWPRQIELLLSGPSTPSRIPGASP